MKVTLRSEARAPPVLPLLLQQLLLGVIRLLLLLPLHSLLLHPHVLLRLRPGLCLPEHHQRQSLLGMPNRHPMFGRIVGGEVGKAMVRGCTLVKECIQESTILLVAG